MVKTIFKSSTSSSAACGNEGMVAQRLVTVDMDGTIADISRRREYALQFGPDKSIKFYSALLDGSKYHMDDPIEPSRVFLHRYASEIGGTIVYLSGRREGSEIQSEAWLRAHKFPEGKIVHRKMGHRSLDFKTDWLKKLKTIHTVEAHFGDRLDDDGGAAHLASVPFVHIKDNKWPSFDSVFQPS